MNWINNICGCLPFQQSIIGYLNNSQQVSEVIEEEKCTQEQDYSNIYAQAKSKSFNFMQLKDNSDDEDENPNYYSKQITKDDGQDVIDVFWYPKEMKGEKWEIYKNLLYVKKNILMNVFGEKPGNSTYDRIYESQDELQLAIFWKFQTLPNGKKINVYRFSFVLKQISIDNYQEWVGQKQKKQKIQSLLQKSHQIDEDPEDKEFILIQRFYKKLMVINPHQFIIASKTEKMEDEDLGTFYLTTIFSVKQGERMKSNEYYSNGFAHLCGLKVTTTSQGLHFEGYLNFELKVNLSPNMLKQPLAKEIRVFIQKLASTIRKSDAI